MTRRLTLLLFALLPAPLAAEPARPKLVVLVVFDQLRGDYIDRWKAQFGPDGFRRLTTEGAWFVNCHYPYACTATGPGHASMLTGCGPDVHGIIGNTWYDRASGAVVNCATAARYNRVPPLPKVGQKPDGASTESAKKEATAYGTPERMLAPTFGEVLKAAHPQARVIGLSFKDRSAVLPVGPKADGAYWLDSTDGMIVTSTYFGDGVHPWVAEFNKARVADRWFGKPWDRLRPDLNYARLSGPDEVTGEGKGTKQGVTFPHPTDGGLKRPGKAYYDALYNSPFGNDLLLELAKAAVIGEQLGKDAEPDLVTISFSSSDSVGHCWGPDSQEVLDTMLRADRTLAELLTFLDEKVGKGQYLVALTADHGICPLPEVSATHGIEADRMPLKAILTAAEAHLRKTYDRDGAHPKARWIENFSGMWVYLNHDLIARRGCDPAEVARTLANYLENEKGVLRTFTRAELGRPAGPGDAIGRRMRKAYHPGRCGDVGVVGKPYWVSSDSSLSTGTNHGSPHRYDTHVPLIVFGPNVRPGPRKEEVVPATIASIFAKAVGVPAPAKAEYPVPAQLFGTE